VWAFQTTHHDIFDYDLPAQPILVDITKDGRKIPAVVQLTKQGFVFVFDRRTGEPIHPIVEKPVPQGTDALGEWLSPTSRIPRSFPQLTPSGLQPEEAWGFTPVDRYFCRKRSRSIAAKACIRPPRCKARSFCHRLRVERTGVGGCSPGDQFDGRPHDEPTVILTLVPHGAHPPAPQALFMVKTRCGHALFAGCSVPVSPLGAPCSAPPWGKLSAVDLNTGKIKWEVPIGTIESLKPLAPPLMMGSPYSAGR